MLLNTIKQMDSQHNNIYFIQKQGFTPTCFGYYEGWNFNSGNYLFTTDTK